MKLGIGDEKLTTPEEVAGYNELVEFFKRLMLAGMVKLEKEEKMPVEYVAPRWVPTCSKCGCTNFAQLTIHSIEVRISEFTRFTRNGSVDAELSETGFGAKTHPAHRGDTDDEWIYCSKCDSYTAIKPDHHDCIDY